MHDRTAAAPRRTRVEALDDLITFLTGHGPGSEHPLPALNWYFGAGHALFAELKPLDTPAEHIFDMPLFAIGTYADALGTTVEAIYMRDRVQYLTRGFIPDRDGIPRTRLLIWTEVVGRCAQWDELRHLGLQTAIKATVEA